MSVFTFGEFPSSKPGIDSTGATWGQIDVEDLQRSQDTVRQGLLIGRNFDGFWDALVKALPTNAWGKGGRLELHWRTDMVRSSSIPERVFGQPLRDQWAEFCTIKLGADRVVVIVGMLDNGEPSFMDRLAIRVFTSSQEGAVKILLLGQTVIDEMREHPSYMLANYHVVLDRPATSREGRWLPAGSSGIILHVVDDQTACVVQFGDDEAAVLADVQAEDIT